jgi:hypothetical protein
MGSIVPGLSIDGVDAAKLAQCRADPLDSTVDPEPSAEFAATDARGSFLG